MAHGLDRLQQRNPWLAFPVAVWKKFGDDQSGNLAALVAYYSFASLFPLLLVFVTVLNIVLRDFPSLRTQVVNSAFGQFPVIGPQLQQEHDWALKETGPALVFGLVLAFLGARGVAGSVQNALNTVWGVPLSRRPGFPWNQVRSITLIIVVGLGVVITSVLSGLAAGAAPLGANIGAVAIALVLNIGIFWLVFRLATAREITTRELFPGALLAAIVWQALQLTGGYIVRHQIAHASSLYGGFALVLGLLAWLFMQAQFTLYAVEAAVVRSRGLWPRSLLPPPYTAPDRRALAMYAEAAQRRPHEEIIVRTPADGERNAGS